MAFLVDPTVASRVAALQVPFNRFGLDPYGISSDVVTRFFSMNAWLYRHYFRVKSYGIHHVPDTGGVMLVGNHSGGLPVDGGMVLTSLLLDHEPPRLGHGMVDLFANRWPFVSTLFNRVGQFSGLPEHAERLLFDGRVLMVFPEGSRGTGKLFKDRYKLVRFGTGFMRLALKTQVPVVPFSFIGGEEAIPTLFHLKRMAKWIGVPYIPVPIQLIPFPLPVSCQIHFGEPLYFEGRGDERDAVIEANIQRVRARIQMLIQRGLEMRDEANHPAQLTGEGPGSRKETRP